MYHSLDTLDLGLNQIDDVGATAIATAIQDKRTSIATISLGSNNIGDKGATALSEALKENTKLRSMDVFGNAITKKGAKALRDAFEYNDTLGYIGDSLVGDSELEFLMPIVQKNHDNLRVAPKKLERRRADTYAYLFKCWE